MKNLYPEKPEIKKVRRNEDGVITLSFNKRIDEKTASNREHYEIYQDDKGKRMSFKDITVDGNMVKLSSENFPNKSFKLKIKNIEDTPELWLFDGYDSNKIDPDTVVNVRENNKK